MDQEGTSVKKALLLARGLLVAVIVSAVATFVVLILRPPYWMAYAPIIIAMGLAMLLYYIPSYKNLKAVQLIMENTIIPFQLVVMDNPSLNGKREADKIHANFGVYSFFDISTEYD